MSKEAESHVGVRPRSNCATFPAHRMDSKNKGDNWLHPSPHLSRFYLLAIFAHYTRTH